MIKRLSSRVSNGDPDACVVLKAVLMVFTCLSMKPLDLGYRDDDFVFYVLLGHESG